MADPEDAPRQPSHDRRGEADRPDADPAATEDLRARVRRQRRHIEDLTGQDPLRGGIDD
jgi:hypothetical protein